MTNRDEVDKHLATFASVMQRNPLYYGMYLGYADGSFYELINLDASKSARKSLRATHSDKWVVISIDGSAIEKHRHFEYLDDSFNTRIVRSETTDFLATERGLVYRGSKDRLSLCFTTLSVRPARCARQNLVQTNRGHRFSNRYRYDAGYPLHFPEGSGYFR